jgi:hypothetical protein
LATSPRQRLSGFGVSAFTGCAGKVGVVSRASQDSRTLVRFISQLGKHSGGSAGCCAYLGSVGICADLTGKLGSGAGGVAQPDSNNSTSDTLGSASRVSRGDFLGVYFDCIIQLLLGLSVRCFLERSGRLAGQALDIPERLSTRRPGSHPAVVGVPNTSGK